MEGALVIRTRTQSFRSRGAGALAAACALAALVLAPAPARADDPSKALRRAEFSVERGAEIDNDRTTAVLAVTDEDADAARLTRRVNETMSWALETAKGIPAVRARSGGYQTWPIERDGRIRHWRSRQELILESDDLPALTELLGTLQSRLELVSIGFSPSPERRRAAEDRLIADALTAFRDRAGRVRESLGAAGWELVHVAIQTDGQPPVRPFFQHAGRAADLAEVAPPVLEAGTSRVVVTASGTIELR
jgi:predicted secreted protein